MSEPNRPHTLDAARAAGAPSHASPRDGGSPGHTSDPAPGHGQGHGSVHEPRSSITGRGAVIVLLILVLVAAAIAI
jgi:hypothetical protein